MRVIVSLQQDDKHVVAILSPYEEEKLCGKLQLRNIGEFMEYDDGVEYAYPYYVTVKRVANMYMAIFERVWGVGAIVKYLSIKFRNLADLSTIVNMLERYCNDGIKTSEKEKQMIKQYCVLSYAPCGVVVDFDIYSIVKRLWIIGRKLRLF